MNEKKELQVAALENGTVIDHIPSDKSFYCCFFARFAKYRR